MVDRIPFARFHVRPGNEAAFQEALRKVGPPTRAEPGCAGYPQFRSTQEPRLFHIHSLWIGKATFDHHGELPHALEFLDCVQPLINHSLDVVRAIMID
jgi:quinol monooxygenase YgiN